MRLPRLRQVRRACIGCECLLVTVTLVLSILSINLLFTNQTYTPAQSQLSDKLRCIYIVPAASLFTAAVNLSQPSASAGGIVVSVTQDCVLQKLSPSGQSSAPGNKTASSPVTLDTAKPGVFKLSVLGGRPIAFDRCQNPGSDLEPESWEPHYMMALLGVASWAALKYFGFVFGFADEYKYVPEEVRSRSKLSWALYAVSVYFAFVGLPNLILAPLTSLTTSVTCPQLIIWPIVAQLWWWAAIVGGLLTLLLTVAASTSMVLARGCTCFKQRLHGSFWRLMMASLFVSSCATIGFWAVRLWAFGWYVVLGVDLTLFTTLRWPTYSWSGWINGMRVLAFMLWVTEQVSSAVGLANNVLEMTEGVVKRLQSKPIGGGECGEEPVHISGYGSKVYVQAEDDSITDGTMLA